MYVLSVPNGFWHIKILVITFMQIYKRKHVGLWHVVMIHIVLTIERKILHGKKQNLKFRSNNSVKWLYLVFGKILSELFYFCICYSGILLIFTIILCCSSALYYGKIGFSTTLPEVPLVLVLVPLSVLVPPSVLEFVLVSDLITHLPSMHHWKKTFYIKRRWGIDFRAITIPRTKYKFARKKKSAQSNASRNVTMPTTRLYKSTRFDKMYQKNRETLMVNRFFFQRALHLALIANI